MIPHIFFKGEFTDLNTYSTAERNNRYAAATIKEDETLRAYSDTIMSGIQKFKKPVYLVFKWVTCNKRKDKDNISFAKKFILDGVVHAKVLKSDGYDYIKGFMDFFEIDKNNPGVYLYFIENSKKIRITNYIGRTIK